LTEIAGVDLAHPAAADRLFDSEVPSSPQLSDRW
jgi:hypothetical protein